MNTLKTILSYHVVRITLLISHTPWREIRQTIYAWRFTILLLLPVLLSACQFYTVSPPMPEYYYLNPDKDLSTVGRTALVELENNSSYPQISADVTESLFQALQKKQLFGLAVIRRSDPAWRSLQLGLNSVSQTQSTAAVEVSSISASIRPFPKRALRRSFIDLSHVMAGSPDPV